MPTAFKADVNCVAAGALSADNPAWRSGLQLLNAGSYWGSHEALEVVWRNAQPNSRERYLAQGLIQLANGLLKGAVGQEHARRRLAKLSREAFERAFPRRSGALMGIEATEAFRAAAKLAGGCTQIRFNIVEI